MSTRVVKTQAELDKAIADKVPRVVRACVQVDEHGREVLP